MEVISFTTLWIFQREISYIVPQKIFESNIQAWGSSFGWPNFICLISSIFVGQVFTLLRRASIVRGVYTFTEKCYNLHKDPFKLSNFSTHMHSMSSLMLLSSISFLMLMQWTPNQLILNLQFRISNYLILNGSPSLNHLQLLMRILLSFTKVTLFANPSENIPF